MTKVTDLIGMPHVHADVFAYFSKLLPLHQTKKTLSPCKGNFIVCKDLLLFFKKKKKIVREKIKSMEFMQKDKNAMHLSKTRFSH